MQSFNLHKKIRLRILNFLLLSGVAFGNPIGDIVESTGVGSITRNSEDVGNNVGLEVLLKDEARTQQGRMKIVFLDNEVLDMTEGTYAYIDEAYYDPNPNLSRMSIRMVQGTARFTSGQGLRINKANVDVSTPTAQITIKGTDFTTSIDEIGRSLIILLPDEDGNASGVIDVTNNMGTVTLDEAYQATMVSSLDASPTSPVTIANITPGMIDNMFIVNPPSEVRQAMDDQRADEQNDDQGILDVDFLEFNELEQDALADSEEDLEFSELDIDMLGVDFLTDLLDVIDDLTKTTVSLKDAQADSGGGTVTLKGAAIGFNSDSQYNIFVQDGDLYFYRNVNGLIEIVVANGNSGYINTTVEGYSGRIDFGTGDPTIEIIINQSN